MNILMNILKALRRTLILLCLSILSACSIFAADEAGDSGNTVVIPDADLSEFKGRRIGVQAGTSQEAEIPLFFEDAQVFYYGTLSDAVLALKNDKIDAFFGDDMVVLYAAGLTDDLTVISVGGDEIQASLMFQKSERGDLLLAQYNDFLEDFSRSGRLGDITEKWFISSEEEKVMDNSELPDINGVVRIVTEAGYAPFEYIKDGEMTGFDIELVREFCREYGYHPEFFNTSFDSVILGIYTGKFDIAAGGLTITEERKRSVNFGDPYMTLHGGLLVRKDKGWTGTVTEQGETPSDDGKGTFFRNAAAGLRRTFVEEDRWKLFVSGMLVTLAITAGSVLMGTVIGFVFYLLCRHENRLADRLIRFAQWLVGGMPLVVFLMVLFYVVFPRTGLSGTAVAVIGFTVVFGFTMLNLIRSGVNAVDSGQSEAACALGYSDIDAFFRIILPQAAKHFMPSYLDEVLTLVKDTAVVGYITVMDVTKIGDIIRGRTYDAVFPLFAVVVSYFILSALFKALLKIVTEKVDTKKRPPQKIMKGVEIR